MLKLYIVIIGIINNNVICIFKTINNNIEREKFEKKYCEKKYFEGVIMEHNYKISLYQIDTEDGLVWMAEYPELKYCAGSGLTPELALVMAEKELPEYLELLEISKNFSSNGVNKHDAK